MKHSQGPLSRTKLTNVQQKDVQPNAVDLRLDKVFKINNDLFVLSEGSKVHRTTEPVPLIDEDWYRLEPGHYEVTMENIISVGEGEAGWVITRSTLNRNGLFLTSGLYDSGYSGAMAGVLHVTCGPTLIQKGTRIGQYLSFDSECVKLYDGSYGFNQDGTAKAEEQKYHQ
jgi:deoxycytidine triphosphate deaminase